VRHALALVRQLDGVPRAHLERLDDQGIRPVEEESTEVIMLRRQPQRTSVDDGGGGNRTRERFRSEGGIERPLGFLSLQPVRSRASGRQPGEAGSSDWSRHPARASRGRSY
jgi:hypothetical protein